MSQPIQKDAIGVILKVTAIDEDGDAVDYSDATTMNIIIGLPDGTTETKTATFTTDGTDGAIQYATISGDIDNLGVHSIQGRFRKTGLDVYSEVSYFEVLANI